MAPAISVIMPAYNAEKYIAEAIQSILDQTFKDFELIVLNDGSTDSSSQIAGTFTRDPRVKIVDRNKNMGLVKTLNEGLEISTGKYIARMDADDISYPERFQMQFDFLESHPDIGICGTAFRYLDTDTILKMPPHHDAIKMALLSYNPFGHPTVMMKRNLLVENQLTYSEDFFLAEDYELWTRLLDLSRGSNLPDVLLSYRIHKNQISAQSLEQEIVTNRIRLLQLKKLIPDATKAEQEFHLKLVHRGSIDLSEVRKTSVWFKKIARACIETKYASAFEVKLFYRRTSALRLYNGLFMPRLKSTYRLLRKPFKAKKN